MLSEISQREKDKYHMISYVEYQKQNKQTKQNKNRLTDTENKQVVARGEGVGGMREIGERD